MAYDIATHPKLSAASVALRDAGGGSAGEPSEAFTAEGSAAEVALGLYGTDEAAALLPATLQSARLAVATQINHQVELGEGRVKKSETIGERRVDFADADTVHPLAKTLAARVLAELGPAAPATDEDPWAVVQNTR